MTTSTTALAVLRKLATVARDTIVDRDGWFLRPEELKTKAARADLTALTDAGLIQQDRGGPMGGGQLEIRLTGLGWTRIGELEAAEAEAHKPEVIEARVRENWTHRAENAAKALASATADFTDSLKSSGGIASAIAWSGASIVQRQAEATVWAKARGFVEQGKDGWLGSKNVEAPEGFFARLRALAGIADANLMEMSPRQRWESGASDPFRRACDQATLTGEARAWADIATWTRILAERADDAAG